MLFDMAFSSAQCAVAAAFDKLMLLMTLASMGWLLRPVVLLMLWLLFLTMHQSVFYWDSL